MTTGLNLSNEDFSNVITELDRTQRKELLKIYRRHLRFLSKPRKPPAGRVKITDAREAYR